MRLLALIGATTLVGISSASFDLMLIPQPGTNRVQRYDPVNQVALGSFSTGVASVANVAANNSSTNCIAGASTSAMINYSTGERGVTGSSSALAVISADGSSYNDVLSTNIRVGSMSTLGILGGTSTGLASISSIVHLNATTLGVMGKDVSGNIVIGSYNAGTLAQITPFFTLVAASDVVVGSTAGQMARFKVTSGASTSQRIGFVYRSVAGGSAYRYSSLQLNGDGSLNNSNIITSTTITLSFSSANAATTVSAVAGHSNVFLVGADAAGTGTRIVEMTGVSGLTFGDQYVEAGFTAPTATRWSMSNVVAPEPGTMAALALGVAAVLKRRRK